MRTALDRVLGLVASAAVVGAVVGSAEASLVLLREGDLFLSGGERRAFVLAALLSGASLCVLVSTAAALFARLLGRVAPLALGGGVALASAWAAWLLTAGRRVHELSGRGLACVVLGVALGASAVVAVRWLQQQHRYPRRVPRALLVSAMVLAAVTAMSADALVLRRLYPAFHTTLAVTALGLTAAAALLLSGWAFGAAVARSVGALGLCAALAAPSAMRGLADAPNARFAAQEASPIVGKLLARGFATSSAAAVMTPAAPVRTESARVSQTGVDLRGHDILLITIDALRSDRLRVGGGHGLTPEMDALAAQSVAFTRAYTPTPHTSYALGSMLTGKYLRPVLSLPNAPAEHATLPRILRRHGYRTAGFYPPAIFFVHKERFEALHADHFGFEYVKEMYAPARTRVAQVRKYLDGVMPDMPVLVWVHLFEPHEPYEPPPEYRNGESPQALYDGEVRDVDAAVGELVRMFRGLRPRSTVILTADHGEEFGEHGGYHHGTTLYEEQVRVPMLWSLPGGKRGRVVQAPVDLVDIAPTVLSALGIPRDARMRGDDIGALLAHDVALPALRVFASIDDENMWSDGRHKLVCGTRGAQCRLYDLDMDPLERRPNMDARDPRALALRTELAELVASLPSVEAMAMQGGTGWPKALSRARLGDISVGPDLLPLLGSERGEVRAEALRAIARLRVAETRHVVVSLAERDPDASVRDEAAVCALALGDVQALPQVRALMARALEAHPSVPHDLAVRAAVALAERGVRDGVSTLLALAGDVDAEESARVQALALIAELRDPTSLDGLIVLLADVRLRPAVLRALGKLGGSRAADAIARALAEERYPQARAAAVEALLVLGDPRARKLALRFLGTDSGVPEGVGLLLSAGAVHSLADGAEQRMGTWMCDAEGCSPGADAALRMPLATSAARSARVVLRVRAPAAATLGVAGQRVALGEGVGEVGFVVDDVARGGALRVEADQGVRVVAAVFVPSTPDIPPPAPEPFDAGVEDTEP